MGGRCESKHEDLVLPGVMNPAHPPNFVWAELSSYLGLSTAHEAYRKMSCKFRVSGPTEITGERDRERESWGLSVLTDDLLSLPRS